MHARSNGKDRVPAIRGGSEALDMPWVSRSSMARMTLTASRGRGAPSRILRSE